jgi:putative peptidoglycan lipid II flippase
LAPAFYSLQDTWTPLKIGLICLAANVVFIAVFMSFTRLQHAGLALATSLSSILNLILLFWKLGPKLGKMDLAKQTKSLLRILLCSVPMGFAAYLLCSLGNWTTTGNVIEKVLLLGTGIVVGLGVYFICSYLMKNEEMIFLMKMVKKKTR